MNNEQLNNLKESSPLFKKSDGVLYNFHKFSANKKRVFLRSLDSCGENLNVNFSVKSLKI